MGWKILSGPSSENTICHWGLGRQTQDGGSCHCFSQTAGSQVTTGVGSINGGQTSLSCLFDFTKGLGLTRQNDDTENIIL